ncbi:MAG: hypothetical protein F4X04_14670 [Holophagales bacterium]|nr:hypothetical protein [Holophagales bacterium]
MLESPRGRGFPEIWKQQCNPPETVTTHLGILCHQVLEPLRERLGWPILVNSGYRCGALNELVGGSATSQHVRGQAADIRLKAGFRRAEAGQEAIASSVQEWDGRDLPGPILAGAGGTVHGSPARDGWLWMAAALMAADLGVHQLIHEYGNPFAPNWVHIAWRDEPRGRLTAIGRWTGRSYRHWNSLGRMAEAMRRAA